jgi:hypothetical protein
MTRYEKRLEALAREVGLCLVHQARPICPVCDLVWTGTAAEEDELEDLLSEWGLMSSRPAPTLPCRCGAPAICLDCLEAFMARQPDPFERLSPDARARYDVLIHHVRPKPRRGRSHDAV